MIRCSKDCIPCCDYCVYADHDVAYDEDGYEILTSGPVRCALHPDPEHNRLCAYCSFCQDFYCVQAKIEALAKDEPDIRTRATRRKNDWHKAIRKKKISSNRYFPDWYGHLHQYSKNKVHCSCPLCRLKTNNKHRKNTYQPRKNWPMTDKKRLDEMQYELNEIGEQNVSINDGQAEGPDYESGRNSELDNNS